MKRCASPPASSGPPPVTDVQGSSGFKSHEGKRCEPQPYTGTSTKLQGYGISSTGSLMEAIKERENSEAAFFLFPLGGGDGWSLATGGVSPLAVLCSSGKHSKQDERRLWGMLANTSPWSATACGFVSASSWTEPGTVQCIEGQLRLGAFLGIHAVVVPLPECDEENPQCLQGFEAAVSVISKHLQRSQTTNVWVRCDASCRSHRVAFSHLRTSILWGGGKPPSGGEAARQFARSVPYRVGAFLHFSQTFGALPSEWLGESVVAFEVPSSERLGRAVPTLDSQWRVQLPNDIMVLNDSYWGSAQPMFLSSCAFIVELIRRRAAPVFPAKEFNDLYRLLSVLYEMHVADVGRDKFIEYEDVLQLPLQPLGHMLPSGIYEVFEEDRTKYQQYYAAMSTYFSEWLKCSDNQSHERLWLRGTNPETQCNTSETGSVYVVLLGAGRGPLISECLCAATGAGVRVHLFVVEKNPEALELIRLRVRADLQWREWMNYSGHVVETIHADGRFVWSATGAKSDSWIPPYWGLCDLVVSELLGSFGDNELSPECIDGFYSNLLNYQKAVGIPLNPHITSIPQQYTAWVAPLYSARVEESVAAASVGGLTAPAPNCHDRHAALYHTMFVSNVCRGVALCPPQPCWTFHHFTAGNQAKEREVTLHFTSSGAGRCSGFICYFSAVLFSAGETRSAENGSGPHGAGTGLLSTLQYNRTRGLFSWFPAILPVEPCNVVEVRSGDQLRLHLRRCVDREMTRVWYTYEAALIEKGANVDSTPKMLTGVMNDDGWASSISLLV